MAGNIFSSGTSILSNLSGHFFRRFFSLGLVIFCFPALLHSQLGKEANFWYFGTNAGLDFNTGAPVAVTNGALWVTEGCSSISDANGNLLFYTDGRNVWNANHALMPNGNGLLGGAGGSATQQALIVKRPGSNTIYYIFTVDEQTNPNGLRYSEVDMSLATGLGDVTANKNVLLYTPTTEKLTAVKHCNGTDIWVISHEKNTNTFRNFLVTAAGVNAVSVNSSAGTPLNTPSAYAGQMKVSPTGAKLATVSYSSSNILEIFDFDNVNGTVSNAVGIANNPWGYGLEFSPNGQYLYVTELQFNKIHQFDVCAATPAALLASKVQIGTSANRTTSLQLGPDKKIYVGRYQASSLGVINLPNVAGVGCNYVDNGVGLSGRVCNQGLPGFVQSFFRDTFPDFTYVDNCLDYNFTAPPSNCANPINKTAWNFGDPGSGAANTSTQLNPNHTFSLPGTYTVTLIVNCVDTIQSTLNVNVCPLTVTTNTSSVCPGVCTSVSAIVSAGAPAYSYAWSPNIGSGPGPHNVCPTNTTVYTVTVTDAAGNTAISTSTVNVHPVIVPNSSKVDVNCNGAANGSVSVSPTGGTPGFNYSWNTGPTGTSSISNLAPGTYSVTITDANGCTTVASESITQPAALSIPTNVVSNVSCNGLSNGSASVTPSGGTTSYTYSWSNGQNTQNATGLSSGVYTVTVTDANNCVKTNTVNITQPATPVSGTVSVNNNVSCFNGADGSLTANGGGGSPGYTYAWSTGPTSTSLTGLTAGSYSVVITDSQGCTGTASASITQPSSAVTGTVSVVQNVSCFNGNNGSANAVGGGGTPGYTYAWSNGQSVGTATGLAAGNYSVTITDNNGCTYTDVVAITQPAVGVTATVTVSADVTCNGGNNGSLSGANSGGVGPYAYSWSQGATTTSLSGLTAGTYSLTVTDANGCTAFDSGTITEPPALTTNTVINSHVLCFNGTDGAATITGSGGVSPYTYAWSHSPTTSAVSGLSAGTYSVIVTDANGCTTQASLVITQPASALTATLTSSTDVSCFGGNDGSAMMAVNGGTTAYTYNWSNGSTASSATGLSAGSYTFTVTDANGCTATNTVTVTQPASALTATASVTASVTCNGGANGTVNVNAGGGTPGYTYSWTSGATSQSVSGLTAGAYSVTVTDNNGCSATDAVNVNQPPASITSTVSVVNDVSCNGGNNGSANVASSGGAGGVYNYLWSNGQTNATSTGLTAGNYTITVTDGNGCTTSNNVAITEPPVLNPNGALINNVSCFGGNDGGVNVAPGGGTPGYTYLWSNAATTSSITGLTAGNYSVTITDNNGCTATSTIQVTEPAAPVTATVVINNHVSCFGGNNGSMIANAGGGTAPYSYTWNNAQTTQTASNLTAGGYTVTVIDANGCSATDDGMITEPLTPLSGTITVNNDVSCFGGSDGNATVNASGGTAGYSYVWSGSSQTTQNVTNLSAGNYSVTITDANGCTLVETTNITQPATAVSATVTVTNNVSCNGGNDGAVSIAASGGTAGYNYLWDSGQTLTAISSLVSGVYNATVTDANGCTVIANGNVTQPPVLTSSVTVNNHVSCFGGSDGNATISANGGTIPYNYLWSVGGATTQSLTNLSAGVYTTTVTDAMGCVNTASVTITQPASALTGTISVVNHVSCFGGSDGSATINSSGGTIPYNYSWNNGQTINPSTGLVAGSYTVTVTDANGCTYEDNIAITEPATAVSATVTATQHVNCNGGNDGSAQVAASGGTGAYTYLWSNASTSTSISGLTAALYSATVTDANGCTAIDNVNITEPPVININLSPSLSICDGAATTLSTAVAGGSPGFNYYWSTTETAASINVNPAATTTYSVAVTDANNCTATSTVTVTVMPPLTVTAVSTPTAICVGKSTTLSATPVGGLGNNTFSWSPSGLNTQTVSVSPTTNTVYTVTVSNTCGIATNTVEVTVNPLPVVSFSVDVPDGCPEHCVNFENTTPNAVQSLWVFGDGGNGSGHPTAAYCYSLTGQYSVSLTVTDGNGCSNSLEKTNYITVYPEPQAAFIASPYETSILAPTIKFTDQSIDADGWSWSFGGVTGSSSTEQNPSFNYSLPGTYSVQLIATNQYGCSPDTAWTTIEVKEDYVMYVPNAFTPNGDGLNDVFMPLGMGVDVETFELFIYDRWGNLIFETNDLNRGWDGRANGGKDIAQQDTYVWKLRIYDFEGNIHGLVGHINLIR